MSSSIPSTDPSSPEEDNVSGYYQGHIYRRPPFVSPISSIISLETESTYSHSAGTSSSVFSGNKSFETLTTSTNGPDSIAAPSFSPISSASLDYSAEQFAVDPSGETWGLAPHLGDMLETLMVQDLMRDNSRVWSEFRPRPFAYIIDQLGSSDDDSDLGLTDFRTESTDSGSEDEFRPSSFRRPWRRLSSAISDVVERTKKRFRHSSTSAPVGNFMDHRSFSSGAISYEQLNSPSTTDELIERFKTGTA